MRGHTTYTQQSGCALMGAEMTRSQVFNGLLKEMADIVASKAIREYDTENQLQLLVALAMRAAILHGEMK